MESVTDSNCGHMKEITNRNDDDDRPLDPGTAAIMAELGIPQASPELRRQRRRYDRARKWGRSCALCGRALNETEPVWRWVLRGVMQNPVTAPACGDCIPARSHDRFPAGTAWPCAECGRPVVVLKWRRGVRRILCSQRCRWTANNRRVAVGIHERDCPVCGERFHADRSDATMCSPACRQKAYRARRSSIR